MLFKQTNDLFKQLHDPESGEVIGLLYRGPRTNGFITLGRAQVRSRRNIYAGRSAAGEVSEAVAHGLEVWDWALRLFDTDRQVQATNVKTIHQSEAVQEGAPA